MEKWRDIPGYGGEYQASTEGNVRKVYLQSGKTRILKPYMRERCGRTRKQRALKVRLMDKAGHRVERTVISIVAQTFMDVHEGMVAAHRNGLQEDNCVNNIVLLSRKALGKKYGAQSKRRPVVKITPDGECVEFYSSARHAARENNYSYQAIMDRCERRVKREFAIDDFSFRWDT